MPRGKGFPGTRHGLRTGRRHGKAACSERSGGLFACLALSPAAQAPRPL